MAQRRAHVEPDAIATVHSPAHAAPFHELDGEVPRPVALPSEEHGCAPSRPRELPERARPRWELGRRSDVRDNTTASLLLLRVIGLMALPEAEYHGRGPPWNYGAPRFPPLNSDRGYLLGGEREMMMNET